MLSDQDFLVRNGFFFGEKKKISKVKIGTPILKHLNCSQSNGITTIYTVQIYLNHFSTRPKAMSKLQTHKKRIIKKEKEHHKLEQFNPLHCFFSGAGELCFCWGSGSAPKGWKQELARRPAMGPPRWLSLSPSQVYHLKVLLFHFQVKLNNS